MLSAFFVICKIYCKCFICAVITTLPVTMMFNSTHVLVYLPNSERLLLLRSKLVCDRRWTLEDLNI